MQVAYSIGARFFGGGIGHIAYQAVFGLHSQNRLNKLLCGSYQPSDIPQSLIRAWGLPSRILLKMGLYDRRRSVQYVHNLLYDSWASRQLTPTEIFHGWGNYSLKSMQRAKLSGAVTIIERASSHPNLQRRILIEEYDRWGLNIRLPQKNITRALKELENADYVLVPSAFVEDSFLQENFPSEKLIKIPFGVDTNRFIPSSVNQNATPFRVLFVGQVSVRKGILYLLQAWQQLGWIDAELWIVGRISQDIRPLLEPYFELPAISLYQHITDPKIFYQQADVFAFPTLEEGSALVTYEAMASGLPVITTVNAGAVLRDGVEGFIIDIRSAEQVAEKLETLRSNAGLRQKMSKAARNLMESFTWNQYRQRYSAFLLEALS